MTQATHMPGEFSLVQNAARTGCTVRSEMMAEARGCNATVLDDPAQRCSVYDLFADTYRLGYTPSPQAHYARVEWRGRPVSSVLAMFSVGITMTLRDDAGNSVAYANPGPIPLGFDGALYSSPVREIASRFDPSYGASGWLNLDTLRATLTDPDWSVELLVTTTSTGAAVTSFELVEVPRYITDSAEAYNIVPASFLGGRPVAGSTSVGTSVDDFTRLLAALESGRTTQRTYLSLAGLNATTSSTIEAPLSGLEELATYRTWRIRVRRLYAAAAAGEPIKFRFYYSLTGVAAETAGIYCYTGASSSPYLIAGLPLSAGAWTDWTTGYFATNGANQEDTIGFTAKVSDATATLTIQSIQVIEAAT